MAENKAIERKHKSPWVVILKRFSGNKMGVIGTVLIICLILVAILAPLLEPYSFKEQNMELINEPPSSSHLLGTDEFGR
ncbi:ABC transporter permease, partial [bacterium]|nr:ABC transporter permease [bacterium]